MKRRLVNGVENGRVAADDRGLQYGDGLFETMYALDGRIRNFPLHVARLEEGCRRLGFPPPDAGLIERECADALGELGAGVVKLVLTRGPGPRGYRPPPEASITRVITASGARTPLAPGETLTLRVCETTLGQNPRLAGIKHLNRLEQVLACAEWNDAGIAEGLMLSGDGRLICATAANVFVVRGGRLQTPDIRDCGVAGVMRQVVLQSALELDIGADVCDLTLDDVESAAELFVTNAVTGIRPVGHVINRAEFEHGPVTGKLMAHLAASGAG